MRDERKCAANDCRAAARGRRNRDVHRWGDNQKSWKRDCHGVLVFWTLLFWAVHGSSWTVSGPLWAVLEPSRAKTLIWWET